MTKLVITRELRALLRIPLGDLLTGNEEETMTCLEKLIVKEKAPRVICVGDRVCRNAIRAGKKSWIKIVDGKEMRKETGLDYFGGNRIFLVENTPGTINGMAWEAVAEAIKHDGSLVVVKGEEDLLTLPAVLESPERSMVIYGQPPHAGIVTIRIDKDKKDLARAVIDAMILEPDQA